METNKILKSHVLDVIFDNRNKSYGAYELRMNYQKRASRAMLFTLLFACLAVSMPMLAALLPHENEAIIDKPIIDPFDFIPLPNPEPKNPEPKNPDPIDVTTHVAETIPTTIVETSKVKDKEVESEEPLEGVEGSVDHIGTVETDALPILPSGGDGGTEVSVIPTQTAPEPTPEPTTYEIENITDWPEFLGGEDQMMAFLKDNLKYPPRAIQEGIEGRVVLGFVVNKNGEIDEVKVVKPIGGGCDEEAMRVVKKMPKWKAGKYNGKAVNVYYNLPITFEISQ